MYRSLILVFFILICHYSTRNFWWPTKEPVLLLLSWSTLHSNFEMYSVLILIFFIFISHCLLKMYAYKSFILQIFTSCTKEVVILLISWSTLYIAISK